MKFLVALLALGLALAAFFALTAPEPVAPVSGAAPGAGDRPRPLATVETVLMPVVGVRPEDLRDSYTTGRSGGRMHQAIDVFAPRGTPVVAMVDGTLTRVGRDGLGGNVVRLRAGSGRYAFYYAHLDAFAPGLREGQAVAQGDTLGTVGTTGNARGTPPHLHLQMLLVGRDGSERPLNPYRRLRFSEVPQRAADRVRGRPPETSGE